MRILQTLLTLILSLLLFSGLQSEDKNSSSKKLSDSASWIPKENFTQLASQREKLKNVSHNETFKLEIGYKLLTGKILQFGKLLNSENAYVPIESNEITSELSLLNDKTVRILCSMKGSTCNPIRYEIYPFLDSKEIKPWTIKKIPDYVNHNIFAFNPTVSPDGKYLFWTAYVKRGKSGTQKIWYSKLDEKGLWEDGKEMSAPLNNEMPSAVISALPGGNELFVFGTFGEKELLDELSKNFETKVDLAARSSKNSNEYRKKIEELRAEYDEKTKQISSRVPLYKSFREKDSWSKPSILKFPDFYNLYRKRNDSSQEIFGGSTLSSSGRILIYSSQHKDSKGRLDLYVSKMLNDGSFPLGTNLGEVINTTHEEMAPFLASDDRTLYFSSDGHKGLSIYMTKRIGEGWDQWTKPVEVSENLKGVNFFSIPANSDWAYISKDGRLFMAYLPKEMRPEKVVVVNGKVLDTDGNPLSADIHYESLKSHEKIGSAKSDPSNGNFSIILPFGENYGFYAQKKGYLPVSQNLNLSSKKKFSEKVEVILQLPPIRDRGSIQINNLFFESKSFQIAPESAPELDRLAEIVKENPDIEIQIEGHTDNVGKKKDNLILSEKRAAAVAEYLFQKHSISKARIQTKGFGDSVPLSKNDSEEARKKNRRVNFTILKKSK
ncbi:OmpA family protein [Leptospira kirschneri]|uniref:OmpA family protein n=1 Tax=Leptospira kirschneri str. 200802841 TaxID=1193047 RepID=A0A828Y7A0_9LEPT|nr:OmpA family protein [Leptospira kirschneri]EKO52414.1 OmpA family protein [Leptospira kirschneri str. 200802841]EKQ84584.1 OmpA family protein [Leptospira kirschneri serovar Grippotyphosa str. Moskva]EKR06883.1 OmpA family protein [Leptospira kirschneri serovar Valbuzzi str. 200702274]EMK04124.1 OmpA family protein [Leptospira kirschneri str. MMD1493]EMN24478.1 OmpA family protein [Leptospira kirschneri serovar Sokoine str. RM1]